MVVSMFAVCCSPESHYAESKGTERLDEEEICAVPRIIDVSRSPEQYCRLDDEEDLSNIVTTILTENVSQQRRFRSPRQLGFERLESERNHTILTTIPEEISLGDISTLYSEECSFDRHKK